MKTGKKTNAKAMRKSIIIIFMAISVCVGLFACGKDKGYASATAYGSGYSGHYTRAEISLNDDNTVRSLRLDEYLPINEIGRLDRSGSTETVAEEHREGGYAKWVKIGDKVFKWTTGNVYANESYPELGDAFKEFYVDEVTQGNFWICKDEEGTPYDEIVFNKYRDNEVEKSKWCSKRENGYVLPASTMSLSENLEKIENAVKGKALSAAMGADITGATLEAHDAYMAVAVKAYNQALNV